METKVLAVWCLLGGIVILAVAVFLITVSAS